MKNDFTKPKPDLDVFVHGLLRPGPKANVILSYPSATVTDLQAVLAGFAEMVVDLAELSISYPPPPPDPDIARRQLIRLRTSLDRLYPSSVWPDTTTEIGGRFAWAIRARIAQRLHDLE